MLINKEYGQWGPWSTCSVTCGSGLHSRSRACLSESCANPLEETEVSAYCIMYLVNMNVVMLFRHRVLKVWS